MRVTDVSGLQVGFFSKSGVRTTRERTPTYLYLNGSWEYIIWEESPGFSGA
jgi:hypothetical protein